MEESDPYSDAIHQELKHYISTEFSDLPACDEVCIKTAFQKPGAAIIAIAKTTRNPNSEMLKLTVTAIKKEQEGWEQPPPIPPKELFETLRLVMDAMLWRCHKLERPAQFAPFYCALLVFVHVVMGQKIRLEKDTARGMYTTDNGKKSTCEIIISDVQKLEFKYMMAWLPKPIPAGPPPRADYRYQTAKQRALGLASASGLDWMGATEYGFGYKNYWTTAVVLFVPVPFRIPGNLLGCPFVQLIAEEGGSPLSARIGPTPTLEPTDEAEEPQLELNELTKKADELFWGDAKIHCREREYLSKTATTYMHKYFRRLVNLEPGASEKARLFHEDKTHYRGVSIGRKDETQRGSVGVSVTTEPPLCGKPLFVTAAQVAPHPSILQTPSRLDTKLSLIKYITLPEPGNWDQSPEAQAAIVRILSNETEAGRSLYSHVGIDPEHWRIDFSLCEATDTQAIQNERATLPKLQPEISKLWSTCSPHPLNQTALRTALSSVNSIQSPSLTNPSPVFFLGATTGLGTAIINGRPYEHFRRSTTLTGSAEFESFYERFLFSLLLPVKPVESVCEEGDGGAGVMMMVTKDDESGKNGEGFKNGEKGNGGENGENGESGKEKVEVAWCGILTSSVYLHSGMEGNRANSSFLGATRLGLMMPAEVVVGVCKRELGVDIKLS